MEGAKGMKGEVDEAARYHRHKKPEEFCIS
jgi:hypothetical protein